MIRIRSVGRTLHPRELALILSKLNTTKYLSYGELDAIDCLWFLSRYKKEIVVNYIYLKSRSLSIHILYPQLQVIGWIKLMKLGRLY